MGVGSHLNEDAEDEVEIETEVEVEAEDVEEVHDPIGLA